MSRRSLNAASANEEASGPLSGPSTLDWRRTRLLRIGSAQNLERSAPQGSAEPASDSEHTPLVPAGDERPSLRAHHSSYGALPTGGQPRTQSKPSLTFRARHGHPPLPTLALPTRLSISNPATPFDRHSFRINAQRPISAYDAPPGRKTSDDDLSPPEIIAKANGIRVW